MDARARRRIRVSARAAQGAHSRRCHAFLARQALHLALEPWNRRELAERGRRRRRRLLAQQFRERRVAAFVAANGAYTALLVPDVQLRLHARAGALGLVLAATGTGFLVGAPAGRALLHRFGVRPTTSLSLLATSVAFIVWFGTDRLAVAVAAALAAGASAVVFLVGRHTQVQLLTPDGLLGRVSAAHGRAYWMLHGSYEAEDAG